MGGDVDGVVCWAGRVSFDGHETRPVGACHESGVDALFGVLRVLLDKDVALPRLAVDLPGSPTPLGDVVACGGITPRHLVVTVAGFVHAESNEVSAPELLAKSEVLAVLLPIAAQRVFPHALLAER